MWQTRLVSACSQELEPDWNTIRAAMLALQVAPDALCSRELVPKDAILEGVLLRARVGVCGAGDPDVCCVLLILL